MKIPCEDCLLIPLCKQKINIKKNDPDFNFDYAMILLSKLKCSLIFEFIKSKKLTYIYNGICDMKKVNQVINYLRER